MADKLKENYEQIEKIMIILLLATVLLSNFLPEVLFLQSLVMTGIPLFYLRISEKKAIVSIILLLMAAGSLAMAFHNLDVIPAFIGSVTWSTGYLIFGIFIILVAVKETRRNRSFQMLTFLLGLFLIIQPVIGVSEIFEEIEQAVRIFPFALAFVLATIIYNDNLWESYSFGEKNVLKTFLLFSLVTVFHTSLNQIDL